ncbi:anti-sigma factor domain-containing protein [Flagellimonas sp.]|jgi:anti-sigma-K factor RskA|uniref:anti-sigma factor domain-containing protein n=1 Tax=Flagellimonas sp. TaxID=2058762 RepID=UPI003BA84E8D|tara:strand:+ start:2032 stop:2787 length:756 start_codon:yes stop_codon:yes gene_type:complete
MIDKKRILEEGLLELYLTEELSEELTIAVEETLEKDKELKEHFDALEADFERMGMEQAIAPPNAIKVRLKNAINQTEATKTNWVPLSIAAGFALIFGLSTFWLYVKWQDAESNLSTLQSQTSQLQRKMDNLESEFRLTSNRFESINNPDVVPLVLYGNQKAPNGKAVAYVNHKSHLVLVNPKGLPTLPKDKTYQMWSDVNGEMINMGTLRTDNELVPLKYIENAESLNITIEPAGGSDHPTVEELVSYVIL